MSRAYLAQVAREASWAETLEAADVVPATAAVEAGGAGALVDVHLAVLPGVARWTDAAVAVNQVLGGGDKTMDGRVRDCREGV